MTVPTVLERARQANRLLRSEGPSGVVWRVRRRAATRLMPPESTRLLVDAADFRRLASAPPTTEHWVPAHWRPGRPLTIAWVCVPPGGGSGGHTTMFRMVRALEAAGHTCVVYLRDRHGWELDQHRRTIREWWPGMKAEVRDVGDGIEDCDAILATGWDTAYDVRSSPARGARFYFVQDFEPAFYPSGSAALLAEATYSFGFHGITAGRWLAGKLTSEYAMPCDAFDFGSDLEIYQILGHDDPDRRDGVCYYCRPSSPRRAHELAVFALEIFAQRHPEVEIHLFGERVIGLPFEATQHGLLTPEELSALYHRSIAGLVLSATNVSLVPHEMLAAGCVPVVNDAEHNRVVLDNDEIEYTHPSPMALADAMSVLVSATPIERHERSTRARESVGTRSWDDAAADVETALCAGVCRVWEGTTYTATAAHTRSEESLPRDSSGSCEPAATDRFYPESGRAAAPPPA